MPPLFRLSLSRMRYIALLRGINVGGNTKVSMPELKQVFNELGFENVSTYINSGNIAFDVGGDGPNQTESNLVAMIEQAIQKHFALPIQVMVRRQDALNEVLEHNPFDGEFESHKEMHVLFMKDEMPKEKEAQLLEKQTTDERFSVLGREIYCHLRLGVADSLLGKGFIEKKLKVPVTGRNWRTVQKLADL